MPPGRSPSGANKGVVGPVGALFFPLDLKLQLGTEGYSPLLIRRAVRQAAPAASFPDASEDLQEWAGVALSPPHGPRLSERSGTEWAAHRDARVEAWRQNPLPRDYRQAPAGAAIGSLCVWHLAASGFVAIVDVGHLLGHLSAAARAAGAGADAGGALDVQGLTGAWTGHPALLVAAVRAASRKAGPPPAAAKEDDPRRVLAETVTDVTNNRQRRTSPAYRRLGLPISSAPVASVIKPLNRRVQGREKFWRPGGAEAILPGRTASRSEDERAETSWSRPRPQAPAVGNGRLGRRARSQ